MFDAATFPAFYYHGFNRSRGLQSSKKGLMLLKICEAAALLRLHRNTIRTMINDGRLEAVDLNPFGRRPTWRVKVDGLFNPPADPKYLDIKRRAGL